MQPAVRIGTHHLTIYRGSTVLVTDNTGEIHANAEHGLFCHDTRFLSHYEIIINGVKWLLVQATPLNAHTSRLHFTNPDLGVLDQPTIPAHALGLHIDRRLGGGLHEDLTLTKYLGQPVSLRLRIRLDSDFADIFDVRAGKFVSRGVRDSIWDQATRELQILYRNENFHRALIFRIDGEQVEPHFSNGQILCEIELPPGGTWRTCNTFSLVLDGQINEPAYPCAVAEVGQAHATRDSQHDHWTANTAKVAGTDYRFETMFRQAVDDIGGLRIHEYDIAGDIWVPAAGVPWFVTLFGRDSLIVAYQTMMVSQSLTMGPLTKLAQFQAGQIDDYRDAEPGKIMHEVRFGELAHFQKIPHTPYYGTADATILYLIVLSEYYRWTGKREVLQRFRQTALRCLSWIDTYGDRDGDGFQEYERRSPSGYYNQSW